MMKHILLALALAACTKASKETTTNEPPRPTAAPRANATVTLTSVSFADDCGGTAPFNPPAPAPSKHAAPSVVPESVAQDAAKTSVAKRRCEQTAMQLAIGAQADTEVHIKSIEVFDEAGKSLGTLTASKPTRWIDASSAYEAWDEKVAAKDTARVSYVLSQPAFVNHYDSHDRTYTVKVVASVGGVDQPLQTSVMIVAQPAPVPT